MMGQRTACIRGGGALDFEEASARGFSAGMRIAVGTAGEAKMRLLRQSAGLWERLRRHCGSIGKALRPET